SACFRLGPDPRRALGPAAKSAAQTGRTRDRTRPMLQQRQKVLAKAPSTRDPKRTLTASQRSEPESNGVFLRIPDCSGKHANTYGRLVSALVRNLMRLLPDRPPLERDVAGPSIRLLLRSLLFLAGGRCSVASNAAVVASQLTSGVLIGQSKNLRRAVRAG